MGRAAELVPIEAMRVGSSFVAGVAALVRWVYPIVSGTGKELKEESVYSNRFVRFVLEGRTAVAAGSKMVVVEVVRRADSAGPTVVAKGLLAAARKMGRLQHLQLMLQRRHELCGHF